MNISWKAIGVGFLWFLVYIPLAIIEVILPHSLGLVWQFLSVAGVNFLTGYSIAKLAPKSPFVHVGVFLLASFIFALLLPEVEGEVDLPAITAFSGLFAIFAGAFVGKK